MMGKEVKHVQNRNITPLLGLKLARLQLSPCNATAGVIVRLAQCFVRE